MTLNGIIMPTTADVVVVYRDNCDAKRCDRNRLPYTQEGFYLATVLGGENLTDTVYFRWNERYKFWHVAGDSKVQVSTGIHNSLSVPCWRIMMYARRQELNEIDNTITMNLNGQRRMWCDVQYTWIISRETTCQLRSTVLRQRL